MLWVMDFMWLSLESHDLRLLFIMVCRGLFEKDKLLYAVMLTLKCQEIEKELKLNEVMALLTGLPGPAKEEKPADSGD